MALGVNSVLVRTYPMGLLDFFRRPPRPTPAVREVAPLLTELAGDGGFAVAVVGESHYRRNFDRVCGTTADGANNMIVQVVLVCERDNQHDPDAVRIDVGGLPVGHLSRAMAKKYRARLAAVRSTSGPGPVVLWSAGDGIVAATIEASMGFASTSISRRAASDVLTPNVRWNRRAVCEARCARILSDPLAIHFGR
jgi:hypothetical protein